MICLKPNRVSYRIMFNSNFAIFCFFFCGKWVWGIVEVKLKPQTRSPIQHTWAKSCEHILTDDTDGNVESYVRAIGCQRRKYTNFYICNNHVTFHESTIIWFFGTDNWRQSFDIVNSNRHKINSNFVEISKFYLFKEMVKRFNHCHQYRMRCRLAAGGWGFAKLHVIAVELADWKGLRGLRGGSLSCEMFCGAANNGRNFLPFVSTTTISVQTGRATEDFISFFDYLLPKFIFFSFGSVTLSYCGCCCRAMRK